MLTRGHSRLGRIHLCCNLLKLALPFAELQKQLMGQALFWNPQQGIADAIELALALEKQGGGLPFKSLLTQQLPAQLAFRPANQIGFAKPLNLQPLLHSLLRFQLPRSQKQRHRLLFLLITQGRLTLQQLIPLLFALQQRSIAPRAQALPQRTRCGRGETSRR